LNIIDATVDAHLKDFNVNSNLSFEIKPMIIRGPSPGAGFTLAFNVHKPSSRVWPDNWSFYFYWRTTRTTDFILLCV